MSGESRIITVTCADTGWTAGGGTSWCTITKDTNTTAKLTVTSNLARVNTSTSARGMKVVCSNGPQTAWIDVHQIGNASYNRSSMVEFYKQTGDKDCAFTCAAMCVKIPPQTLINKGFKSNWADWSGIAKEGGMTATEDDSGNLQKVYNTLKEGYPVIAHINDKPSHWVVICEYHGNPADLVHKNFYCYDPNGTNAVISLPSATRYSESRLSEPFKIVIFR